MSLIHLPQNKSFERTHFWVNSSPQTGFGVETHEIQNQPQMHIKNEPLNCCPINQSCVTMMQEEVPEEMEGRFAPFNGGGVPAAASDDEVKKML